MPIRYSDKIKGLEATIEELFEQCDDSAVQALCKGVEEEVASLSAEQGKLREATQVCTHSRGAYSTTKCSLSVTHAIESVGLYELHSGQQSLSSTI